MSVAHAEPVTDAVAPPRGPRPRRVAVADDQELVRRGLRMVLELFDDVEVVLEASSGRGLLGALAAADTLPDVVLLDARMPRLSGIQTIPLLREQHPGVRILVVSTFDDDDVVLGALRAGADGFFLKDATPAELHRGILEVDSGHAVIDPRIGRLVVDALRAPAAREPGRRPALLADRPGGDQLTPRELEVAALVATGASNRAIADALYLTEGTVKNHVSTILRKLTLRTRTQLAVWSQG